jgi:hypothetical protein
LRRKVEARVSRIIGSSSMRRTQEDSIVFPIRKRGV